MMRPALIVLVCVLAALSVIVTVVAAQNIFGTAPVSATVTIVVPPLPEDLDGDGCVGPRDLALVARGLGPAAPIQDRADINDDGLVDIVDVASVAVILGTRYFGSETCP